MNKKGHLRPAHSSVRPATPAFGLLRPRIQCAPWAAYLVPTPQSQSKTDRTDCRPPECRPASCDNEAQKCVAASACPERAPPAKERAATRECRVLCPKLHS